MKFIHTGDLHLGLSLKTASYAHSDAFKRRSQEMWDAFYALCETFKQSEARFMLMTGDLFDHARVKIHLVEEVFNVLNQVGKPVYITIGNHDTFLHNQAFEPIRKLENIYFFSNDHPSYAFEDIFIHGMNTLDFTQEKLTALVSSLKPASSHILCLHGDIFNAKDEHFLVGKEVLKTLPFDYIALGHIHKHEFIDKHIAYSGNLEPIDFSETGSKGYILGDLKEKTFVFNPTNKRHFQVKNIVLTPTDTLQSLKQKIFEATSKKERDNDFIRAVLEGRISKNLHLSEQYLFPLTDDYYYLEFKNKTKVDINIQALKIAYKDTIIEVLIDDYLANQADEESFLLALDALLETEEGSR